MAPLGVQGDPAADGFVERQATDRVLLPQQQIGDRNGQRAGVFEFIERARPVTHAAGNIDQQRRAEVRVFFVLLDVIAILLGPDLPIDVPQIVAGGVLAVLAKLDRLAEKGTAVDARQKSLDHVARAHLEPANPGDRLRMQKSFGIGHRASTRPLWWE